MQLDCLTSIASLHVWLHELNIKVAIEKSRAQQWLVVAAAEKQFETVDRVSLEPAKFQPIRNCLWQARPEPILALRSRLDRNGAEPSPARNVNYKHIRAQRQACVTLA